MILPGEADGLRVDKALRLVLPDQGRRLRQRLCAQGRVFVDGRKAGKGLAVKKGQRLSVFLPERAAPETLPRIICRTEFYAAIYKPEGTHSAHVRGKDSANMEDALPVLFPDESPILLNRLDYLTSGLLLVGFGVGAAENFRKLEAAALVEKRYSLVLEGLLDHELVIKNRLNAADRARTRVLDQDDPDPARWTCISPMKVVGAETVARATIKRGARHQIRAHAAHAGFPIVGDPLYGSGAGDRLCLHHYHIQFEGFTAEIDGLWLTD